MIVTVTIHVMVTIHIILVNTTTTTTTVAAAFINKYIAVFKTSKQTLLKLVEVSSDEGHPNFKFGACQSCVADDGEEDIGRFVAVVAGTSISKYYVNPLTFLPSFAPI